MLTWMHIVDGTCTDFAAYSKSIESFLASLLVCELNTHTRLLLAFTEQFLRVIESRVFCISFKREQVEVHCRTTETQVPLGFCHKVDKNQSKSFLLWVLKRTYVKNRI